jgi:hypothetical protein
VDPGVASRIGLSIFRHAQDRGFVVHVLWAPRGKLSEGFGGVPHVATLGTKRPTRRGVLHTQIPADDVPGGPKKDKEYKTMVPVSGCWNKPTQRHNTWRQHRPLCQGEAHTGPFMR